MMTCTIQTAEPQKEEQKVTGLKSADIRDSNLFHNIYRFNAAMLQEGYQNITLCLQHKPFNTI